MTAAALLWLKTNWKLTLAGSCAALVIGFVLLALHWKAEAEKNADLVQTQREVIKSADRHDAKSAEIQTQVAQEQDKLRSLPDANQPLDPERRAALCDAIKRVRHAKHLACELPAPLQGP